MSREDDWKIHTLMGNDLTGWEWEDERCIRAIYRNDGVVVDEYFDTWDIPHYSTTWEGAGLVMEWLMKHGIRHRVETYGEDALYKATVSTETIDLWRRNYFVVDHSAPLALCKAYISAMEDKK